MAVVNGVCTRSTLWELLGWGLGSCQTSSASRPAPGWNRRRWTFHTQKNNRLTLTADTVSASARQRRDGNTVSAGTGCAGFHHCGNVSPVLYSDRRAMRHSICKTNARPRLLHTFVVASTSAIEWRCSSARAHACVQLQ